MGRNDWEAERANEEITVLTGTPKAKKDKSKLLESYCTKNDIRFNIVQENHEN